MMRREKRVENGKGNKNVLYIWVAILAATIIAFIIIFIAYNNKLKNNSDDFSMTKVAGLVPNNARHRGGRANKYSSR